ncbi:SET and MYND domain-containing protein 4-like [Littorina saxatilis]|uniref:Protein-lysine N-methyltransferase SMYD4 n=1 Tax=Littorina saxatilis TaxID=31220 RepID=A0AAN9G871_9CAEN
MAQTSVPGNWQAELDALLKTNKDCGTLDDFKTSQTDAERVKFIFDLKLLSDIGWVSEYFTSLCRRARRKDPERAVHHKQEGNKLFVAKQDEEALLSYTRSVQFSHCESDSEKCQKGSDLALAYGNRSAVLFRLHNYEECLTDIDRALNAGFPKETRHKLLVRRSLCYARLGKEQDAIKVQEVIRAEIQTCDQKTADHLSKEVEKISAEIQSVTKSLKVTGPTSDIKKSPAKPVVSFGINDVLVQASSAVEMKTSPSQGRFLQARQSIKAGDTLIVERPFAGVLLPPHYTTHCLHCFGLLPGNPIGCKQCSGVLYCDEDCRGASWESYHQVECLYMDLLHSVGIAHLSLRVVLNAGLPFLVDFLKEKDRTGAQNAIPGVTKEGRYERNYLSVYDLMTHTADMTTDDLFQYSLTASILLGVLIHSGWFESSRSGNPTDSISRDTNLKMYLRGEPIHRQSAKDTPSLDMQQVFTVGGVLLRHVQQLVCNAHAITALQATQVSQEHLVETQSQVRVATAIYPTASLMNHSCDPTIISSFQKDVLIVKSVKDVPCGGEIFNCYGPHCKRMKRQERLSQLKSQYFFDCQCQACTCDEVGDGSIMKGLKCPKCGKAFPVSQQELVCPSCHVTVDMAAILSQLQTADTEFNEGVTLLSNGQHKKALARFKSCLKVRSKAMSAHNHDLGQTHDAIAQCLATTGCYPEASEHLKHSLAVTEAIFGPDGIETARELHKMAEVQIHAGRPTDALKSASRALDLAEKLYCHSDDWVQELLCLKTALTKIIAEEEL